jgi:hypothetical protein
MTTEETTTEVIVIPGLETPVILPPPIITMNDILSSVEIVTQKEQADKVTLESIGNIGFEDLKSKLLVWGTLGFPNVYEIHKLIINPPGICSDGVTRDLTSYIQFCSGKSIHEHVASLQQRVQDMVISFANMGSYIAILVSKV